MIAAAALVLTNACGGNNGLPEIAVERAETFIDARLPKGARSVHAAGESWIDTIVLTRFDAPRDEALTFAERVLKARLREGFDPQIEQMGARLDWWLDKAPPNTLGDATTLPDVNRSYQILIAPEAGQDGTTRVWLVAFSS